MAKEKKEPKAKDPSKKSNKNMVLEDCSLIQEEINND